MGYDRRRELGDSCGFCVRCGWGRRFMTGEATAVPAECPDCGGAVIRACPACGESISSLMAITCAGCGEPLRARELFGVEIRRKPERHARDARRADCSGAVAREMTDSAVDAPLPVGNNGTDS